MTTPTVTELPRRLEPVSRDTFAEDEPSDGRVACHRENSATSVQISTRPATSTS